MKRRHNKLPLRLQVNKASADQAFVCWRGKAVMQGFLERERLCLHRLVAIATVVDRKTEAIALGRIGKMQGADLSGNVECVALLQTDEIWLVPCSQSRELTDRSVLAKVVADDLGQVIPPTEEIPSLDRGRLELA